MTDTSRHDQPGSPYSPTSSASCGDLDRITTWVRVFGLVNSPSGFQMQPLVIDGFTALMIELFGEDSALCPRAVAGAVELPFGSPVIIEGEVEVTDG